MRRLTKILRDDRGANAIEYALIAALIGIGLIGSLVGTRTSLSSIFGSLSTTMGSASPGGGQPAAAQPNPAFAGKTLSTRTATVRPWGATQYSYTYADGSTATYYTASAYNGSYYRSNLSMTDAATGLKYTYTPSEVDTTTGQTLAAGLSVVSYYASGNQKTYTNYSLDQTGQTWTGNLVGYADSPGAGGLNNGTVTAPVSQYQSIYDQYNAYKANP